VRLKDKIRHLQRRVLKEQQLLDDLKKGGFVEGGEKDV
jgi:hypothetical protein